MVLYDIVWCCVILYVLVSRCFRKGLTLCVHYISQESAIGVIRGNYRRYSPARDFNVMVIFYLYHMNVMIILKDGKGLTCQTFTLG